MQQDLFNIFLKEKLHRTNQIRIRTSTDDIHGEIINQKDWPKISDDKLDQYLNKFRGKIKQIPPKVSSVNINGERAYKKFLKNEDFELSPREVKIEELILMKWDQLNGILEIKSNVPLEHI